MNKKKLIKSYKNVLILTTKRCNLSCPRCYLRSLTEEQRRYSMTRKQFVRIIERLKEQNVDVECMIFHGGEPTVWPHLVWAISLAKAFLGCRVRVVTNGVDRNAEDYGNADVIGISHYGGINRLDILRLRKQLGRKRCKIQNAVHVPRLPEDKTKNLLPSDCGGTYLSFCGDKAYPCCGTGCVETDDGISIEEPFYEKFLEGNPWMNEACKTCIGNRKGRKLSMPGFTVEIGVWDSAISSLFSLEAGADWMRKVYRKCFKWW